MPRIKKKWEYKWVILVICFLMEFLCLGFCSSNPGLYTKAVTDALKIDRGLYNLGNSIRYIAQVFTALYFGTLIGKFGVRKMVCVGFIGLTGSVLIRAYAAELYQIYISSVLWGVGIVFVGGTMAGTIVRRWFHQDVGRYTGIVMSANGLGGAVAAQIVNPLIHNGEAFGYRKAYLISAAISLAIGIVVMIFLREGPGEETAVQASGKKKQPKGTVWEGLPYETLKKKPYFYVTALMVFLTGISLQSVGTVGITYAEDVGMSTDFIGYAATVSSLALMGSKIFVGILYDKKGLGLTLLLCQMGALFNFLQKCYMTNTSLGKVLYMSAAIISVLALTMETVMIPLITGDLFGSAAYHKVLGVMMAMNSLGLCLGSPLGDWCRSLFGSYKPCFWFFAGVMVVVMIGYRLVLQAARREKEAVWEQKQKNAM